MMCHLQARRHRQAGGIIQSESEGLRTRGAEGVIPNPRAGEDWCHSSAISHRKFSLHLPFCSFQSLSGLGHGCSH